MLVDKNNKIDSFKKDLKELLDKYDATIWCDIEGEGATSTTMIVELGRTDYTLCNGVGVDKSDL